ncbi:MAG: hypothetical protein ACTSUE_27710, partial [Promethearchaeota archaeon]
EIIFYHPPEVYTSDLDKKYIDLIFNGLLGNAFDTGKNANFRDLIQELFHATKDLKGKELSDKILRGYFKRKNIPLHHPKSEEIALNFQDFLTCMERKISNESTKQFLLFIRTHTAIISEKDKEHQVRKMTNESIIQLNKEDDLRVEVVIPETLDIDDEGAVKELFHEIIDSIRKDQEFMQKLDALGIPIIKIDDLDEKQKISGVNARRGHKEGRNIEETGILEPEFEGEEEFVDEFDDDSEIDEPEFDDPDDHSLPGKQRRTTRIRPLGGVNGGEGYTIITPPVEPPIGGVEKPTVGDGRNVIIHGPPTEVRYTNKPESYSKEHEKKFNEAKNRLIFNHYGGTKSRREIPCQICRYYCEECEVYDDKAVRGFSCTSTCKMIHLRVYDKQEISHWHKKLWDKDDFREVGPGPEFRDDFHEGYIVITCPDHASILTPLIIPEFRKQIKKAYENGDYKHNDKLYFLNIPNLVEQPNHQNIPFGIVFTDEHFEAFIHTYEIMEERRK